LNGVLPSHMMDSTGDVLISVHNVRPSLMKYKTTGQLEESKYKTSC
jgi:hypothetical protein